MSKYIFILFALFPFFLFAQTPFLHEKEVARLYHSQQYEKALDLLLKIQDKDMDSPFTYKFDGTYRNNPDFYYYVVRSAFYVALKNTDEKLFKNNLNDFRHLCRISGPGFSKSDASFYNDFRNELIKRSERSMKKNNHSEAEEYSQFLVKSLCDTIDIYRKIFILRFN
ncbi:hypothetical protein [uncultured Cytophaga sp.]|uniref:hypothetical protein n=1 Tax=uncultured Cytophaga sp. TaxID=160238 RepID=UPI002608EE6C|nr:hypothetical protein [uncultured Cytophaga sp.]